MHRTLTYLILFRLDLDQNKDRFYVISVFPCVYVTFWTLASFIKGPAHISPARTWWTCCYSPQESWRNPRDTDTGKKISGRGLSCFFDRHWCNNVDMVWKRTTPLCRHKESKTRLFTIMNLINSKYHIPFLPIPPKSYTQDLWIKRIKSK